jgi:Protein of unknown function (DUF2934)
MSRTEIDPQEVAGLAYSYWQARGGIGGSAEQDWYRAEKEIRSRNERTPETIER